MSDNNVKPASMESQKDMLFSKLLPAINNNPFSTTYVDKNNTQNTEQSQQVQQENNINQNFDTTQNNQPNNTQDNVAQDFNIESENDPLENLRSRLFARQGTAIQENYVTVNIIESAVLNNIDHVIQRFNACSCDRCKCDIAAQTLNNLPAKYVVTNPKNMPNIDEIIDNKEVTSALVNAVIKVRANPRH